MRAPALTVLTLVSALAAPASTSAQEYYADVRPVLVERCMGCHVEDGIGWSMEDPEATYEHRREIAGAVTVGKMPPWIAEPGHQEYVGDLSLDEGVVGMVAAWREAGYPKGQRRPDPARSSTGDLAFQSDHSLEVLPGGSYLPDQTRDDDYRCFVVDWDADEPGYITGFRAVPGNRNVAHHVVVHAIEPEMVERYREIDDMVDGPGYECFGGALPSSFDWKAYQARYPDGQRELSNGEWWLTHWAPGMNGHHFPEGTGILMQPGAALVVQMHYYSAEAPGESDAGTRVDFEIASSVERPAFHLVQTDNRWLAGERNGSMVVEPGEMATYVLDMSLGDWLRSAANITAVDVDRIQGFEVHSANLHMHAFGHSGEVTLTDGNGRTEVLLSIPEWDLHWQRDFTFTEPKVFTREQLEDTSLRVRCTYRNPTDETVYGGYGSFDEMCFNFSYVAVKLGERATEAGRQR